MCIASALASAHGHRCASICRPARWHSRFTRSPRSPALSTSHRAGFRRPGHIIISQVPPARCPGFAAVGVGHSGAHRWPHYHLAPHSPRGLLTSAPQRRNRQGSSHHASATQGSGAGAGQRHGSAVVAGVEWGPLISATAQAQAPTDSSKIAATVRAVRIKTPLSWPGVEHLLSMQHGPGQKRKISRHCASCSRFDGP